jgi:hypothetical protein
MGNGLTVCVKLVKSPHNVNQHGIIHAHRIPNAAQGIVITKMANGHLAYIGLVQILCQQQQINPSLLVLVQAI